VIRQVYTIWLLSTLVVCCCCGMGPIKKVNPTTSDTVATILNKTTRVSDEVSAIPVFNSDHVGTTIFLTQSGSYQLAENLLYPVTISVSGVSLDLKGYKIAPYYYNQDAITIASSTTLQQISITNGTLQNTTGMPIDGISIVSPAGEIILKNLKILGFDHGVWCAGTGVSAKVTQCYFSNLMLMSNRIGMSFDWADANVINRCNALYSTQSGFELSNSQANCCFDCKSLTTTGTGTVVGFKSTLGTSNMFQRCVVKQTKTSSTTFGDKACGFLLTSTEQKTKIVDCIVNETDVISSPTAITCGMQLAPVIQQTSDLLSTVTLWNTLPAQGYATAWSPNNEYLAVACRSGMSVRVYKFDGSGLTFVTSVTPPNETPSLSWSPDGKYLAFGVNFVATNVYVYSFNGQALTSAASYNGGSADANCKTFSMGWSPNGKYLAYATSSATGGTSAGVIGILSFDGSSLALASSYSLGVTAGSGYFMAWAPDGSALAIAVGNTAVPLTVIPVNVSGVVGTAVQLSTSVSWDRVLWSPSGKYFAASESTGTSLRVYRWSPTDANPIALACPSITGEGVSSYKSLAWSPNGNYLVAGTGANTVRLYVFNGTSLAFVKVAATTLNGVAQGITWSADGRYIAACDTSSPCLLLVLTAMYGPLNCLVDNCRVCDTLASSQNVGRGLVTGGSNVCTQNIACNNGVNYSYGIPNVYDGRFEITRNVVQPFDNISLQSTL
jgi:WD40 repeat protein